MLTHRGPLANPDRAAINQRLIGEWWVRAAELQRDQGDDTVLEGPQPSKALEAVRLPRGSSLRDVVYLTPMEAALLLGLSKQAVYRLIQNGQLQAVRVGRAYCVPEGAVWDMESLSLLDLGEPQSDPEAN